MKTLTFYPRRLDGTADAFCIADIADSAAETLFVRQMFDTHDSAQTVEVFEDEILLRRYDRADNPGARARTPPARPRSRGGSSGTPPS